MSEIKENNEFIDVKTRPKQPKKSVVKGIFDGSLLTRDSVINQLPFILFIVVIGIIYIGNRYHAEKVIRETSAIQTELKDLRSEAITASSELMYISKQSEVIKLIKEKKLDLIESSEPPKVIKIKSE